MEFLSDFTSLIQTVVSFVIALSIIVTVHEYGHYIVGRWCGIHAEVFSIGFGPTLLRRTDKRGTVWKISLFPLGGYVKFLGDANATSAGADEATMARLSAEERRHSMHGAPLWARASAVAAGPGFNFLLSILVFAGAMMWEGKPAVPPQVAGLVALPDGTGDLRPGDKLLAIEGVKLPDYSQIDKVVAPQQPFLSYTVLRDGAELTVAGPQLAPPRAEKVLPGSAAEAAGLQSGDVVTAIDGTPIWRFEDIVAAVTAGKGAPVALDLWRPVADGSGTRLSVTLSPKIVDMPDQNGDFTSNFRIGLIAGAGFRPETTYVGPIDALAGGAKQTWGAITASVSAIEHIVLGKISSCNLRGAIGIAQGSASAAKEGAADFIWFIAMLSTAVGFINLMPIPVLDGGHLMFHLWEGVTGKAPSDRIMNLMVSIGLALVLSLMAFGLWNDLVC